MPDICMIGPGGADGHGGIGRHVRYVTRHWQTRHSASPIRVLDSYGPSAGAMPATFLRCAATLAGLAFRRRIGVLHLHMASAGSTLRKLTLLHIARLAGVRTVLHVHGSTFAVFFEKLPGPAQWALRASMRRADAVIALGSAWEQFLVQRVGLSPGRVHVMANAVPAAAAREVQAQAAMKHFLFLGRVGARKGAGDLLHALARLREAGQEDWHLTMAGDGDVAAHAALAASLGLADHVSFTGWVDEARAAELLLAADALVLPSHHEGLPMAILEAMAHGLPVVTTPVGAIQDVVADGRNGLLVPPGDVAALAKALARLIGQPEAARAMGAAGQADVTASYGLDAYCARLDQLYQGLLA
jgi:glycosyltransferase involved in cell wall biosynthesis